MRCGERRRLRRDELRRCDENRGRRRRLVFVRGYSGRYLWCRRCAGRCCGNGRRRYLGRVDRLLSHPEALRFARGGIGGRFVLAQRKIGGLFDAVGVAQPVQKRLPLRLAKLVAQEAIIRFARFRIEIVRSGPTLEFAAAGSGPLRPADATSIRGLALLVRCRIQIAAGFIAEIADEAGGLIGGQVKIALQAG